MKCKVMFFLPSLHGGGAERVAVNLIRKLDKQQYDIHLVLVDKVGTYLDLIPDYVNIHNLNSKKTILSTLKLRKKIILLQPDIIFSTLIRAHIALDLALTGITSKPKLIYRSPNSPKLLLENHELNILTRYFLNRAYNNANKIIAQTPEMKDEIAKYHGVLRDKIIVITNPIDSKLIDAKIQNISSPFSSGYINIVAAGRLTKQKGFDILIKSFKDVVHRNNAFRLYIIGEDSGEKSRLLEIIGELNLKDNVQLVGFTRNPYRYFYYSDMYVLSSRWEGLPNTVLENLYLEKPVIATRCIPSMETLIKDKKNGLLVDVEDIAGLSNAILSYQEIDTSYKTIDFHDSIIDDIFK